MSFISYFQRLVVVRRREGEQRRRLLLAAALLGKKTWAFPPLQEQLSPEPLSLARDCHLPGDAAGTGLTHLMKITMEWGLRGRLGALYLPGGAGGAARPKNSPRGFGQCEVSEGVSPGCIDGFAQAVPTTPAGTGIVPASEGAALPRCSLHMPGPSGCPERTTPQLCCALFLFYYYFFPDNILAPLCSQLMGKKVEDFQENLNSCLSNNGVWILNLQNAHTHTQTYIYTH